jgi:hypothetical protein
MASRYRAWSLLVRILFDADTPVSNGKLRQLLLPDESFWQDIISMANANHVTAALWNSLRSKQLDGSLSLDAKEYLESFNVLNLHKNTAIRKQGLECMAVLNSADIEPMPIKGLAYQLGAAGDDVTNRFLIDIDIMVPAESASLAQAELAKVGFDSFPNETVDYSTHLHLQPMWRKGSPATIEIHRAPVTELFFAALPTPEVWKNSSSNELQGVRFRLPNPTDAAMIVFLHNVMIDRCQALYLTPLRSFLDASWLRSQHDHALNWSQNLQRAGRIDAEAAFRRFAYTLYRLAGSSFLKADEFSAKDYLHFEISHMVAAMPALELWAERLDRLTAEQILEQHDARDNGWSINAYRTKEIAAMLVRGVRNLV